MTDFRDEFKVFDNYDYLEWCSTSPAPQKAVKAVEEFLNSAVYLPAGGGARQFFGWGVEIDKVKTEVAKLLNSAKEEIALSGTSTTQGIQIAFDAISPKKGENIVTFDTHWTGELIHDVPEIERWRKRGVEIRVWKNRKMAYDAEDLVKLIDDKTRIVYLDSSTLFGYRFDLAEITKIAHERNALVVLDTVQETGALEIDTKKLDIDFLASGGYKYMTTPFGIGLLYVNKKLLDRFEPPYYGYNNIVGPDEGWMELFFGATAKAPRYKALNDASRYEYGGFLPYPAMAGLSASVNIINSIGIKNVETKIRHLKGILMEELESIGGRFLTPVEQKHWTPITAVNIGANVKEDYEIVSELRKKNVIVTARRVPEGTGAITISVHYPNNEGDITRLIESLKELKRVQ